MEKVSKDRMVDEENIIYCKYYLTKREVTYVAFNYFN